MASLGLGLGLRLGLRLSCLCLGLRLGLGLGVGLGLSLGLGVGHGLLRHGQRPLVTLAAGEDEGSAHRLGILGRVLQDCRIGAERLPGGCRRLRESTSWYRCRRNERFGQRVELLLLIFARLRGG